MAKKTDGITSENSARELKQEQKKRWTGLAFAFGASCILTMAHAQQNPYIFTTFAGQVGVSNSSDGLGLEAGFFYPFALTTDPGGNLYLADTFNHTIRQINTGGFVSTVAGLAGVNGTNDGIGGAARFWYPTAVAVDSATNLYVSDWGNSTIRKITPGGLVTTLAGLAGSPGTNNGTGSAARFDQAYGLAVNGAGTVYVADTSNQTIRVVTPAGVVTTLAGLALVAGTNNGTGSAARFNNPQGIAVDGAGNIYVSDSGNQTIRRITPAGVVTNFAGRAGFTGTNDGVGAAARFFGPAGLSTDSSNNIFVADLDNNIIRKVTSNGLVTTFAGQGGLGLTGSADGSASAARFYHPRGVAVDRVGNFYIADTDNHTIRAGRAPPPPNDSFANRLLITGLTARVEGFNVGATKEPGEPNHAGNAGGGSVWWTWTAPSSVKVELDTIGSSFDTLLAVYTGASVSNMTLIASDDNGGGNLTSKLTFSATTGTVYQIAVDGSNSASGIILLNLRTAPQIASQPQSESVVVGGYAFFRVTAAGSAPFSYQWRHNGANLPSATNVNYSVDNVTTNEAGSYQVVVANSVGSITSAPATLFVANDISVNFKGSFPGFRSADAQDVQVVGNLAFVATWSGLLVIDISDPSNPRLLAHYDTGFYYAEAIAIVGNLAYLTTSFLGGTPGSFDIFDISDPSNPILRGSCQLASSSPRGLAVAGDYAFVANTSGELTTIYIRDEENPTQVGSCITGGPAISVALSGNYAFVADYTNGLVTINVTDPTNCTVAGVHHAGGDVRYVQVVGGYAYAGEDWAGLEVLDISNPTNLVAIGNYTNTANGGYFSGLAVRGTNLYVCVSGGLLALDVSSVSSPRLLGSVNFPGYSDGRVVLAGGNAYVADENLFAINIAGGGVLSNSGAFNIIWDVNDVDVMGNFAYLATDFVGLQVLDISDPANPLLAATWPSFFASDVQVVGQYAYLAEGPYGLEILDVSNPRYPNSVARYTNGGVDLTGLFVAGNYVYVLDDLGPTLDILDIRNPSAPLGLGQFQFQTNMVPRNVYVSGSYVYVVGDAMGLQIIDVSNPAAPFRAGGYNTNADTAAVSVQGDYAYLGTISNGLDAVYIADPGNSVRVGNFQGGVFDVPQGISVVSNRAYVSDSAAGLEVIDISNPTNLVEVGGYAGDEFASLKVVGNFVYASRFFEGLMILDLGNSFAAAPSILGQPQPERYLAGATADLFVAARGTVPLTYQWRFNGTNLPGATAPLLDLPNLQFPQAGIYSVLVSNSVGVTVSSNVSLSIDFPPSVALTNPVNSQVFLPAATVTLAADVNDGDGYVARVDFYSGSSLLGTVTNPPFMWAVTNVAAGTYAFKARATDNEGASTDSDPVIVIVTNQPVFQFSQTNYIAYESNGLAIVNVLRNGDDPASVGFSTQDGTAFAAPPGGIGSYYALTNVLAFDPGSLSTDVSIQIVNDLVNRGSRQFVVQLSSPSAGWQLAYPSNAYVTIIDDDPLTNNFADVSIPPDGARGALQVWLRPTNAAGQWRFWWESDWRNSGSTASNLVAGSYPLQFMPRAGFSAPADVSITLPNAGAFLLTTNFYTNLTGTAQYGALSVTILPSDVANATNPSARGQWRLVSEADTNWHDGGSVVTQLVAGAHLAEFRPIANGYQTPQRQVMVVLPNRGVVYEGGYVPIPAALAGGPAPLDSYNTITNDAAQPGTPYRFCGQVWSEAGLGSGFVAKPRTVLTAAHEVFNPVTLSYASNVWWFFQRQRGGYEPLAQRARGWQVFEGYAAQRISDLNTDPNPEESSIEARNLDVAALYFFEDAGRGGYSGYLITATNSDWLASSSLKLLVGYPVANVPESDEGKMHQTGPFFGALQQVTDDVYRTGQIQSYPGNSGGPLCVVSTNSQGRLFFIPAGVYLGGSGETVVRVIDLDVVDLINRAEQSGHGGTNNTGGGVIPVSSVLGTILTQPAYLYITIGPLTAVQAGGAWRISPTNYGDLRFYTNYVTNSYLVATLSTNFTIEMKGGVPGFSLPTNLPPIVLYSGSRLEVDLSYQVATAIFAPRLINERVQSDGSLVVMLQGMSNRLYSIQYSSNLNDWLNVPSLTNLAPGSTITNPPVSGSPRGFYRAREQGQ